MLIFLNSCGGHIIIRYLDDKKPVEVLSIDKIKDREMVKVSDFNKISGMGSTFTRRATLDPIIQAEEAQAVSVTTKYTRIDALINIVPILGARSIEVEVLDD